MRCECGGETIVTDSRPVAGKNITRRRRECVVRKCKKRYTSYEVFEADLGNAMEPSKKLQRMLDKIRQVLDGEL